MPEPVMFLSRRGGTAASTALDPANWNCAGVTEQVPNAGDILPATFGDNALHVRRESDGSLSAGFNVIHYGCNSVPVQCLGGRKIDCPIRSCAYSLDGPAISAKDGQSHRLAAQFVGLNLAKRVRVSTSTWGPFVLVNAVPGRESLLQQRIAALSVMAPGFADLVCGGWFSGQVSLAWPQVVKGFETLASEHGHELRALPTVCASVAGDRVVVDAFPNLFVICVDQRAVGLILKPTGPTRTDVTVVAMSMRGEHHGVLGTHDTVARLWELAFGSVEPAGRSGQR